MYYFVRAGTNPFTEYNLPKIFNWRCIFTCLTEIKARISQKEKNTEYCTVQYCTKLIKLPELLLFIFKGNDGLIGVQTIHKDSYGTLEGCKTMLIGSQVKDFRCNSNAYCMLFHSPYTLLFLWISCSNWQELGPVGRMRLLNTRGTIKPTERSLPSSGYNCQTKRPAKIRREINLIAIEQRERLTRHRFMSCRQLKFFWICVMQKYAE